MSIEPWQTTIISFIASLHCCVHCCLLSTLLRLVEDWRGALDRHEYVAAVLMDLSKAFDCLPHDLLLVKLQAYGLSVKACALISSYLSGRRQQVRLGPHCSDWCDIIKGVPQGSILGPLLFNIFINDIFHVLDRSSLHNYADDNTLSYSHNNPITLKQHLQVDCVAVLHWFEENNMQTNPDKFQAISFGKKGISAITELIIDNKTIHCDDSVTLLGIEFDNMLTFNNHLASMCKKAARQLAVLKRIGHLLTIKGKLAIFNSFIESNFNYCPLIWHFCSQTNTIKIEKIQERALRFIYNNYSSTHNDLLNTAGTQYLHVKRLKRMACEVFKIVNNMSPSFIKNLIELKTSKYSMRRTKPVVVPKSRTSKYGLKSFAHEGVRVWNSLPNELRRCENFREFRRLLRCWDRPVCGCSACR